MNLVNPYIFLIFALYIISYNAKSENIFLKNSPVRSRILPSVNSVVAGDIPSSTGFYFMKNYLSFTKSRKFARLLNLSNSLEWRTCKKPLCIVKCPDSYYQNKEWISWMDWLGTSNVQGGNRKYKVNDNYFKKFSNNMAYILGFWWADGYLQEKKHIFSISQSKRDRYILENILKEMKSNNPLYERGNNVAFNIVSDGIMKDIKRLGGFQAKSYAIGFPKNIPKKYMPHFIRGLWDGDGCITFHKVGQHYVSTLVSASKELLMGVLQVLQKEIPGFIGHINKYSYSIYILNAGANDTRRLKNYLYKNITPKSLYLKRKYLKFMDSGEIVIKNSNKVFLSYNDSKKYIRRLRITKWEKWIKYRKENKLIPIPSNPSVTYKNKGWINWRTFVGH